MSLLTKELVNAFIACNTKEKESFGNMIVEMFGGDTKKSAKKLPPRRGNADGGIDGRIPVIRDVIYKEMRPGGIALYDSQPIEKTVEAALCIKIEKKEFDRYQLGAFKNDMEREEIFEGIIISAKNLSMDAKYDLKRINNEGRFRIDHILLSDILKGKFKSNFRFKKNPQEVFFQTLKSFINNS